MEVVLNIKRIVHICNWKLLAAAHILDLRPPPCTLTVNGAIKVSLLTVDISRILSRFEGEEKGLE